MYIKNTMMETGEMVWALRAPAALQNKTKPNPRVCFPAPLSGSSQPCESSSRDLTPSSGINSHALSKNKMSLFRNTANNHYSLHCCYICGTHLAQPKKWQMVRVGWGTALSGEPWAGSRAALQEEEEVAHSSDRPDPQDESP